MTSRKDITKWSKKASFYTKTSKGLRCGLCPNACIITEGESGTCKIRINKNDELFAINYGNPCSVNIDPIEKKPFYHFLPQSKAFSIATAGCNFTCLNCQNAQISQVSPLETDNYDLMPPDVVVLTLENNCQSIAFTYTEPTLFFEYMLDTAKLAHDAHLKNVLISNGFINEAPLIELCQFLDAANIDLKCFSNEIYRKLTGGTLKPVLNSLKTIKEEGVWLEITNLIIPGMTDDLAMIQKMCEWLVESGLQDCPLHFSRFFPTYKLKSTPPTPVETLDQAREIAMKAGIKYVYIGNVPGTAFDDTYCPSCKKTLIKRHGYSIDGNNIADGHCAFCGENIEGVWE
jgi:pyruvate formate lyase activating enzyme